MSMLSELSDHQRALNVEGFAMVRDCLSPGDVEQLIDAIVRRLQNSSPAAASVRRRGEVYAVRNLVECVPEVLGLLFRPRVRSLVTELLGPRVFVVRSILFDKTGSANWHVTWHQDLSAAVRARADTLGYGPWSIKAGVQHVHPPVVVLEQMLTLRLHLDSCTASDGALRVLPGSHRHGRHSPAQIDEWVRSQPSVDCDAQAGTVLLMKPLLLHASSAAQRATHRRVVHFELASVPLSPPLEWHGQELDLGGDATDTKITPLNSVRV